LLEKMWKCYYVILTCERERVKGKFNDFFGCKKKRQLLLPIADFFIKFKDC
jgi:hypothetical protein